jgi:hypothetical protein
MGFTIFPHRRSSSVTLHMYESVLSEIEVARLVSPSCFAFNYSLQKAKS